MLSIHDSSRWGLMESRVRTRGVKGLVILSHDSSRVGTRNAVVVVASSSRKSASRAMTRADDGASASAASRDNALDALDVLCQSEDADALASGAEAREMRCARAGGDDARGVED